MLNPKAWQRSHLLILLIAIWLLGIALLVGLQIAGNDVGLRMPLLGEDRYWLWNLMRPELAGIPSNLSFWETENRNPFSPIWYAAAGPFILTSPEYAYPILRRCVDLFCAISVFVLVDTLGRKTQRFFAFACAVLVLFWNSWGLSVSWNIIAVTGLHVISLWLYCVYLDSDRRKGRYLALSILIYFFANATYLLVAFSFLAITVLAVFRPSPRPATIKDWGRRITSGIVDTSFYATPLYFFVVLWQTMSRFQSLDTFVDPGLISNQLPISLHYVFTAPLTERLPERISQSFQGNSATGNFLVLLLSFGFFVLVLSLVRRFSQPTLNPIYDETISSGAYVTIAYTFVVTAALSSYIISLESISTVWQPGTRTFVIGQVVQPLAYISVIFGISEILARRSITAVIRFRVAAVALLCSLALLSSISYQTWLNSKGTQEQAFLDKLINDIPSASLTTQPTEIIALIAPDLDQADFAVAFAANTGFVWNYYVQSTYERADIGFHFITQGEVSPDTQPDFSNNLYVFGSDDHGVHMITYVKPFLPANTTFFPAWIPYQNILFVKYDGQNWTRVDQLTAEELAGYRVRFERDTPVRSLYARSGT